MSRCENKENKSDMAIAMRISTVSIIWNVVLSLAKLLAGVIASSSAMISDAVHSASDVLSTIIVIIGIRISGRASDKKHQYGHDRFECVASIILADLLFLTGCGIGYSGIKIIAHGNYGDLKVPGILALIAAIVSIVVKEGMFWYTRAGAKKINSGALMADAWHHRSDALSSVGAFIGILGARLGFPVLDPIASIVICLFILKAALDKMVDSSCDEKTVNEISSAISEIPGVCHTDSIMTRQFGNKAYVDVEIAVNPDMSLEKAHSIAENVHHTIETDFPAVKHCMVHVNPYHGEPQQP